MQQLNVNDYYELGKQAQIAITKLADVEDNTPLSSVAWSLFITRWKFEQLLTEPCALLTASQRAVRAVMKAITTFVPDDIDKVFQIDKAKVVGSYSMRTVATAISNFETVLKNDMPEMSTFAVSQIGIMRTDDLINNAYRQVAEPLRVLLLPKAKADIIEAGKCLAFRLSTASAFHACRAIEAGMDQYYEALTGKPYKVSPSGGNNNWGAKTEALVKEKADEKVTEFLTHIRKQYRNPVTHPDVVVDEHEAVDLFIASLSAISMMLGATKAIKDKNQLMLKGLSDGWTEAVEGVLGGVRSNDEESALGLEAGTPETDGSGEEG